MPQYAAMPEWYDWAYSLSEAALLLLSLFVVACIATLAVGVVASYRGSPRRAVASSMPPAFVTAIVLPVSVILGLLVNDVWRNYNDAQNGVLREAATVADATRAIAQLPAGPAQQLGALLDEYVNADLKRDWAVYQTRQNPIETHSALNQMEFLVEQLQIQWQDNAVAMGALKVLADDLSDLERLRKTRTHLSVGRIDNPRWFVLGLLLLCCVALLTEVSYGQTRNHAVIVCIFSLSYGALIYMLLTHDRPFSGSTFVSFDSILQAYTSQIEALKRR
ncbi:MAG: DUF4239 domain-containing protein [Ottowia sp.]|jgi:hypothetical protein|nr:DUF4239 domain-containing protein [Ottowia sp.]